MKIRKIDALNLFSDGGYYDLQTGHYIHPKWLSEKGPRYYTGLSSEDYQKIATDTERYLYAPRIRASVLFRMVAQQLGIPSDLLDQMGFEPNSIQSPYHTIEDSIAYRANGFTDKEKRAMDQFYDHVRSLGLYTVCINAIAEIEGELSFAWLTVRGIEIID